MKKSIFFILAFLICVSFAACKKKDKKINIIKHPTQITVTERFQDYEAQGNYYIATHKAGEEKFLYLTAEVKDLVTGEIINNPKIEWYGYTSLIGVGEFKPNEGVVTRYEPVLNSSPTIVYAVARYNGDSKYLGSNKYFDIKQNY